MKESNEYLFDKISSKLKAFKMFQTVYDDGKFDELIEHLKEAKLCIKNIVI